jgi:hypothetical protein
MLHLRCLVAVAATAGLLLGGAEWLPQGLANASHPYYSYPCPFVSGGHDFDGNGSEDAWAWNPLNGEWLFGPSWGVFGDIPTPADYNNDGRADLAVWRPSNGVWYVQCSTTTNCPAGVISFVWGTPGDIPVPSDYNADGFADFGIWRPSTGVWYIRAGPSGRLLLSATAWGQYGDCPVPGRLGSSGVGALELNIFRPSTGLWRYGRTLAGTGGSSLSFGKFGDIPFSMDTDGDGDGEMVVWRSSTGVWYGKVPDFSVQFGAPGDLPSFRSDLGLPAALLIWRPATQRLFWCNDPRTGCTVGGMAGALAPAGIVPVGGRYR